MARGRFFMILFPDQDIERMRRLIEVKRLIDIGARKPCFSKKKRRGLSLSKRASKSFIQAGKGTFLMSPNQRKGHRGECRKAP